MHTYWTQHITYSARIACRGKIRWPLYHSAKMDQLGLQSAQYRITPLLRELQWLRVPERVTFRLCVLAYRCLHGTTPSYLAESLPRTSDVDNRRRLRSADAAMLVVPSTRRSTLGDRAFPVASARAWNSLPSSVRNAPSRTEDCTFPVVVSQWLCDRDCTAQYNCCLPATTDCRRFCRFVFLFFLILYGAPAMSLTW